MSSISSRKPPPPAPLSPAQGVSVGNYSEPTDEILKEGQGDCDSKDEEKMIPLELIDDYETIFGQKDEKEGLGKEKTSSTTFTGVDAHAEVFAEHDGKVDSSLIPQSGRFSNRKQLDTAISMTLYFRFLFYHLLYFWILGPFSIIVFFPFGLKRHINLFFNMAFWFRNNVSFYIQLFHWASTLSTYYLLANGGSTEKAAEILYSILLQTLLRVSSIAVKYSTFSDNQIQVLESRKVATKELYKEYMMVYWRTQHPEVIIECINDAVRTGRVQTGIFQINFLRMPKIRTMDALVFLEQCRVPSKQKELLSMDENTRELNSRLHSLSDHEVREPENKDDKPRYFDGEVIYHYLVAKNKEVNLSTIPRTFLYCFIRLIVPIVIDKYVIGIKYWGNCTMSTIFIILADLNIFFFVFVNVSFYLQAVIDIKRKRMILDQMNNLLLLHQENRKKVNLPVVNIFDPMSLYGWRSLYTVNQEYGKKFFIRHRIFTPFIIILMILAGSGLALLLAVIPTKLEQGDPAKGWILLAVRVNIDLILYFIITIHLLITSASFNDSYEQPTDLLRRLILLLQNAKLFKEYYVLQRVDKWREGNDFRPELDGVFLALCAEISKKIPESEIDSRLDYIINYSNVLKTSLESERDNNILKVLGIRINKQILTRIAAILIPVLIALQKSLIDAMIKSSKISKVFS